MVLGIIFIGLGILAILKSTFVLLFPKTTLKLGKKFIKNEKTLIKIGLWGLSIGVILLLIGINI